MFQGDQPYAQMSLHSSIDGTIESSGVPTTVAMVHCMYLSINGTMESSGVPTTSAMLHCVYSAIDGTMEIKSYFHARNLITKIFATIYTNQYWQKQTCFTEKPRIVCVLYKKSFHLPVNVPPAFDFAFYVQCLINNQINQCRHWNSLFATLPGDRHISVNESLEIPLGNHLHFQNTAIANSRLDDQMRRAKYEMQYMQNSEHFKINYKQVVFLKTRNLFL